MSNKESFHNFLHSLQIDFYVKNEAFICPRNNIAFYISPMYENCEKFKGTKFHLQKYNEMSDNDIHLITVFEDEWILKQEEVKFFIKSKLGIFSERIYARNTTFFLVDKSRAKEFFLENHLQSFPNSLNHSYGLYKDGDLLACVSYGKHHRNSNQIVLNRLAFKNDIQIIGGASKLIKNSIVNFDEVITWSDNRWSTGKIYENCEFKLTKELPIDYSYYHENEFPKRIPKQKMKKSNTNCPKEITEHQWALDHGYYRIYDCGKKQWTYEKEKNQNS